MPTLIIEDGTIVAGANSWITLADCETYLDQTGRTFTASTEDDKNVLLVKAQRAISTRLTFWGILVDKTQPTCIPRYWGKQINGWGIASNEIPQDFIDAQCEMAFSIDQGSDPFADQTTSNAKRGAVIAQDSKAGPVSTGASYSDVGIVFDPRSMSNYTATMALLDPYTGAGNNQPRIYRG